MHADEEREGFVHIRGERFGIRIDGWTRRALVSHEPRGSGSPGGGRSGSGSRAKGKPAQVVRSTALLAERAGVRVTIGVVEPGTELRVLSSAPDHTAVIELVEDVRAVDGVTLHMLEADLEMR